MLSESLPTRGCPIALSFPKSPVLNMLNKTPSCLRVFQVLCSTAAFASHAGSSLGVLLLSTDKAGRSLRSSRVTPWQRPLFVGEAKSSSSINKKGNSDRQLARYAPLFRNILDSAAPPASPAFLQTASKPPRVRRALSNAWGGTWLCFHCFDLKLPDAQQAG